MIAIPAREDPRDVLVGRRLDDLVGPVTIGTGAPRRAIQLLDWAERERAAGRRLELRIVPIRGNVDTRIELARGGSVDAVVLAAAGLRRLGYLDPGATDSGGREGDTVVRNLQAQILDHQVMLPAPGQGALALEIHSSLGDAGAGTTSRASTIPSHGLNPKQNGVFSAPWRPAAHHRSVPAALSNLSVVQVSI